MTAGQVGTTVDGISRRQLRLSLKLVLGERFALLLALFPLGGVVHHTSQASSHVVLFLVGAWVVASLVQSFTTRHKVSEQNLPAESLTFEGGWL